MSVFLRSIQNVKNAIQKFDLNGQEQKDFLGEAVTNEELEGYHWVSDVDWHIVRSFYLSQKQKTRAGSDASNDSKQEQKQEMTDFFVALNESMQDAFVGDVYDRPLVCCSKVEGSLYLRHLLQWCVPNKLFTQILVVSNLFCSSVIVDVKRNLKKADARKDIIHLVIECGHLSDSSPVRLPATISIKKTKKNSLFEENKSFEVKFMVVEVSVGTGTATEYSIPILLQGFHKSLSWTKEMEENARIEHTEDINLKELSSFNSVRYVAAVYSIPKVS